MKIIDNVMVSFDFVCPECGQVISMKAPFHSFYEWDNYGITDELYESLSLKERDILSNERCPDCKKRIEEIFPEEIEINFEKIVYNRNELKELYKEYRDNECNPLSAEEWIEEYFGENSGGNCWDFIESLICIDKIKMKK